VKRPPSVREGGRWQRKRVRKAGGGREEAEWEVEGDSDDDSAWEKWGVWGVRGTTGAAVGTSAGLGWA
jgi:hypothetical protein